MKPHHEFSGVRIENDFWSFEYTAASDVALRIVGNGKCNAFVLPIVKVARGINVNTNMRHIAGFSLDFMFTKPEISSVVKQNPSAVGIYVNTLVIRPQFARPERVFYYAGVRFEFDRHDALFRVGRFAYHNSWRRTADFDQHAFIECQNPVCATQDRVPVRDDESRATNHQPLQRLLHDSFAAGVE